MTGSRRLDRILGLQSRLASVQLVTAEQQRLASQNRHNTIDRMLADLRPMPGMHDARNLSARADMAQRLGSAQTQLAESLARASVRHDAARQTQRRIDCQRDRLTERSR